MHTEIESKSRITALRERMLRYTRGIGRIVVGWIKKKKTSSRDSKRRKQRIRERNRSFFFEPILLVSCRN